MTYSTFMGLETARRGLSTARTGMDVTGHNVANANTPGYTRQRPLQEASYPYTVPSLTRPEQAGQLGTGVSVEYIQRIRDNFLDGQIRVETNSLGAWQVQNDALSEIETIFMEPSDNGLNTLLSNFWSSWQELSKNGESSPIRTALVQNAVSLSNGFNHIYSQMETVRGNLDQLTSIYIGDINSKAEQIANLNQQIMNIQSVGDQPNDLLDKRDLLLDELAELTNYTWDSGNMQIKIGSVNLVDGSTFGELSPPPNWSEVTGGALTGINQSLVKLQGYEDTLNNLADKLKEAVNAVHTAGYDLNGNAGVDFFSWSPVLNESLGTGDGTATLYNLAHKAISTVDSHVIRMNGTALTEGTDYILDYDTGQIEFTVAPLSTDSITADYTYTGAGGLRVNITEPAQIAAAGNIDTLPGDGANALKMAQLQSQNIVDNTTVDNYYKNLIARIGVDAQEGGRMVLNQEALVEQLSKRRESISGVSLDEEMTNLLQYQYAYQGAARIVTVLDEMLNTLINRMAV